MIGRTCKATKRKENTECIWHKIKYKVMARTKPTPQKKEKKRKELNSTKFYCLGAVQTSDISWVHLLPAMGKHLLDEAAKTPLLSAVSNFTTQNAVYTIFHGIINENPRRRPQRSMIAETLNEKKLIHNLLTILCSIYSHLQDSSTFPKPPYCQKVLNQMHQQKRDLHKRKVCTPMALP